ncbi:MAG: metallophosphoesterase [Pirellulales bacterium]
MPAYLIAGLLLLGHGVLCVAVFNRLHATGTDYRLIKLLEIPLGAWLLAVPPVWWWSGGGEVLRRGGLGTLSSASWPVPVLLGYGAICVAATLLALGDWLDRRLRRPPRALVEQSATRVNVAQQLGRSLAGNRLGRWCAALPGNQLFHLETTRKVLAVRGLPPALAGLTIAHLSDLHLTGRIAREYFEYQIDRANDLQAELIVVTGDILDRWECRDWLPATLGRLRAPAGVYFLLGNHDLRPGPPAELRRQLESLGLHDVGNRMRRVPVRDVELELVGIEVPWFGPAPEPGNAAPSPAGPAFRLLLSHAPDPIRWAARHGFPLMLAGHTHGGQIVFPVVGPVVAPSRYGVRYAGGVFEVDGVVLHVSRGLSSEEPLRWNCPPELALLTLTPRADG